MSYYAFEGLIPVVHPEAYVHPSAVLIGDVIVGLASTSAHMPHCAVTMVA